MADTHSPLDLAARYKRTIASRYRGLGPSELGELPSGKLWVSPKIDGELWLAVLEDGKATLVAHGGRTLDKPPLLAELAKAAAKVTGRTILAGELFALPTGKSRPRVGDVAAVLAEGGKALDRLGWHAFDALELHGAPAAMPYAGRLEALEGLVGGGKRATVVKTVVTGDRAEVAARWTEWVDGGKAEGLVVRSEDGRIYKVKPVFTVDVVVVGFTTRAEAPDEVRSLLLAVVRPDGTLQLVSSVGNLGTVEQRKSLLPSLVALECQSSFRHTSSDGALYRWITPKMVIEVACSDVQSEDSEGRPVQRWTIAYDGSWAALCPLPGASLIHPVFVRVRDDKRANDVDARASQLTERCAVPDLDRHAERLELPTSEVTRREVWTKVTKGKTAVRKLLVWRTNKELHAADWPAWVIHFTDYSPDRKTPLERTVKTAPTEAEASALADALVAENIKKGWNPA